MTSCISYQYAPHRPEEHRGIAHWRGARGGMRALSLPSGAAWLHRQANDPHYDFWSTLAAGGHWLGDEPAATPHSRQPALTAQCVFVLQKDADGDWMLAPLEAWPGRAGRPVAANSARGSAARGACTSVPAAAATAAAGEGADQAAARQASAFIIEIS